MSIKYYPLAPAQATQHELAKEFGTSQVLNICVCSTLKVNIDFGLLKQCIQEEFKRSECLRIRFTKPDKNGDVKQYIAAHDPRDIELADLSGLSDEDVEKQLNEWSFKPFSEPNSPMVDIKMIKLPDGYQGLYISIDHRLTDSSGIIVMINDIMELYCHYVYKSPYPQPLPLYTDALEKDLEKEKNQKKIDRDGAFWDEVLSLGEPLYSDVTGQWKLEDDRRKHNNPNQRYVYRNIEDTRVGFASFTLEPAPTYRLLDYCLNNNVSMTNLLLMGLRTYLSKMNGGQTDISIRNFVSRRSTKLERFSGGSRTEWYPCRTVIEPDTEFLDGIYIIQELQNKIYRHSNYDQARLAKKFAEKFGQPEHTTYEGILLTYQPLPVRLQNPNLKGLPYKSRWLSNGTAVQKLYLTVMHSPDGGLEFFFKYQQAELSYQEVEKVYYYLMRIIFAGVEHPELTVGEIIDLV
ncbi:MAG: condensation domain-containing protein [Clostridiales bacterium]|nr:condensation domain-containing protein [Clostridiales bacterium]